MAETNGPTAQLCRWADTTKYEDIPEGVRRETVTLLYDQLGGMIASAPLPSSLIVKAEGLMRFTMRE